MDAAEPVPEEVAIGLLQRAAEGLASKVSDQRLLGWEIIDDLCNGRPEYVERSWDVARGCIELERDPEVVESGVYALGRMASNDQNEYMIPEARGHLLAHANAASADARLAVTRELPWFLGVAEDARVVSALITLTQDPEDEIRDWATFGLGRMSSVDTVDVRAALVARLADDHEDTRDEAMIGLARRRDPAVKDTILAALGSGSVSNVAVESAARLGDDDFLPLLVELKVWWDVDPELLERAISRCDPAQRAAAAEEFELVQRRIRKEFELSPMQLVELDMTDDLGDLDRTLTVVWKDAAGDSQEAAFKLDRVLEREDVNGDPAAASRRMVEMLGADSLPPGTGVDAD